MNWFLGLFAWLASFFDSQQTTSSRRLQAFAVLVVLMIGNIHFFFWCENAWYHIIVIVLDMLYILLMYSIVSIQDVITLKTGIRLTESKEVTPDGTSETVEKIVTEPQKSEETSIIST